jgi:hypothetical protein
MTIAVQFFSVRPLSLLTPFVLALIPAIAMGSPLLPLPVASGPRAPSKPRALFTPLGPVSKAIDPSIERLLYDLVEKEAAPLSFNPSIPRQVRREGALLPPRPPGTLADVTSALDCQHAKHDISLDPSTGVTTATLELRVKAKDKPLGSVGFSIDEGLKVSQAEVTDREATIADTVYSPQRAIRIDISPPLQPSEETVITLNYSGTLSCATGPEGGTAVCSKGDDFSYFAHQSIFPFIYDPEVPNSFALDALTRDVVLRVPTALDVVATGERVSESVDTSQNKKVSRWTIDKPLSRVVGMYAFAGKLGKLQINARSVPTTLVFPSPEKSVDQSLASWSTPALDFVERLSGNKLPFDRSLSLVRLPETLRDPGTATFGMTLLSDSYARAGDLVYEETWAHENSHLFWGIVVPETNAFESRLMSEGMATLAEIDYSFERHFSGEDRDHYLARRFLPMGLDIRGSTVPPVQLPLGAPLSDDFRTKLYMLWAYYKPSATLDHLRVTAGEDVFARALRGYIDKCSFVGCRPDALREVLDAETGKDFRPFFDRWITGSERPEVILGFTPTPNGADVELTKPDDRPMTLELWLSLADGSMVKRRVDMGPRTTRVHLDAPTSIVGVAASPRHDVLVDIRSAVDGDLDFDGETDGFDILRCARQIGRSYKAKGATGLWNVEEAFDPRCDVDGNREIDEDDLTHLSETFGKLRAR